MSAYDSELQKIFRESGCSIDVYHKDPCDLFKVVQDWWPEISRISDIYSLQEGVFVEDINDIAAFSAILDIISSKGVILGETKALFFGDDLTDESYEFTISHLAVKLLSSIPQVSVVLLPMQKIIILLSFSGEILLVAK